MSCQYDATMTTDADAAAATQMLQRLHNWSEAGRRQPFFAAVGFQGPRLPWSFPSSAGTAYPTGHPISLPQHPESPEYADNLEWFRPTEVNQYSDVRGGRLRRQDDCISSNACVT